MKLCITFLLVFSVSAVIAQHSKLNVGVESGPSFSFLRGNDVLADYHEPAINFSAGLFLQYNFKIRLSLRTNVSFERKGSIMGDPAIGISGSTEGPLTIRTNFDYLIFPLLLKASLCNKRQFFINAGPFIGYLLKQTFVSKKEGYPTVVSDNTFRDRRCDFGISSGIGYCFIVREKIELSFELRNNLGLYNTSAVPVVNDGTIKTNSTNLLLSVSYKFGQQE